jgi:hypothetical protein
MEFWLFSEGSECWFMLSVWHESQLTVESATRTTGIEPAVCAATTHLAIIDDTLRPGTVSFGAILARTADLDSSEMSQEGFDIATALHVENHVRTTLSDGS